MKLNQRKSHLSINLQDLAYKSQIQSYHTQSFSYSVTQISHTHTLTQLTLTKHPSTAHPKPHMSSLTNIATHKESHPHGATPQHTSKGIPICVLHKSRFTGWKRSFSFKV